MTDNDHPEIDTLSAGFYAGGLDAYGVAEQWFDTLATARDVQRSRRERGLSLTLAWPDATDSTLVRKFLARLLDAGWRPPADEAVRAAIERTRAAAERWDAWWSTLSDSQRDRVIEQHSRDETYPPDLRPPWLDEMAGRS